MKIIGEGSFSVVYEVDKETVVKVEENNYSKLLKREAKIMMKMTESDLTGKYVIPVYGYKEKDSKCMMEMKRLKISLGEIMERISGVMDNYSVKNLLKKLIINLRFIHEFGVCHGDIKPDNIMLSDDYRKVYFVDFGLYRQYKSGKKHLEYKEGVSPSGTLRFMSKNVNSWIRMSRRDDLISLGYMMIFLQKRELPWQNVGVMGKKAKYEYVSKMKESIDLGKLCDGCLNGLKEYMEYCYKLGFDEEPDYDYLLGLFN